MKIEEQPAIAFELKMPTYCRYVPDAMEFHKKQ
jgi:hypothetical protein